MFVLIMTDETNNSLDDLGSKKSKVKEKKKKKNRILIVDVDV